MATQPPRESERAAPPAPATPPPWALGDAVTVRAFRLAGLVGRIADTPDAARAALAEARAAGVTLVVATERAAAFLREAATPRGRALLPVVVVVASALGPHVSPSAAERLGQRVRQVLGLPSETTAERKEA